jgi:hypothetical protein
MNAIDQTIRPYGSTTAGRLRITFVMAVLVVGLFAGFGLGRAGSGSGVAPAGSGSVATHGSGHVPRVWVDQR